MVLRYTSAFFACYPWYTWYHLQMPPKMFQPSHHVGCLFLRCDYPVSCCDLGELILTLNAYETVFNRVLATPDSHLPRMLANIRATLAT